MKRRVKYPSPDHVDLMNLRSRAGLTQIEAAELCMVSLRTYGAYENQETRMPPAVFEWFKHRVASIAPVAIQP